MKILFCASEIVPFVKTGGLADMAGSLPQYLAALGHDVRLSMPRYRSGEWSAGGGAEPKLLMREMDVHFFPMHYRGRIDQTQLPGRGAPALPRAEPAAAQSARSAPGGPRSGAAEEHDATARNGPSGGSLEEQGATARNGPRGAVSTASSSLAAAAARAGVPVYLIANPDFFDREELYGENGADYPDNHLRFAFYCMATLWLLKGLEWRPDAIICNDWQTALIPVYLKHWEVLYRDPFYNQIKVVLVIHNLAYQGVFPEEALGEIGLPKSLLRMDAMEYYGRLNFLKAGINFSRRIVTVSPQYAREIQTIEYGCGLEGVLAGRHQDLTGILNGVDYAEWNPAHDPQLCANYSTEELTGKLACKQELLRFCGLESGPLQSAQGTPAPSAGAEAFSQPSIVGGCQVSAARKSGKLKSATRNPQPDTRNPAGPPLAGVISRLDSQKGIELLLASFDRLLETGGRFIILGTGQPEYHRRLEALAAAHPGRISLHLKFDNPLAHRALAACDLLLMPSRFEPCGLTQLYALKYGTVPLVHHTGGLADSIVPANAQTLRSGAATGFAFTEFNVAAFADAYARAVRIYDEHPEAWRAIVRNGMRQDFSWERPAREYAGLLEQLLAT